MKNLHLNEKEIFDHFVNHESLKKIRASLDSALGQPLWWVVARQGAGSQALSSCLELSQGLWHDPRLKKFKNASRIFEAIRSKKHLKHPFLLDRPRGLRTLCLPLVIQDKNIGYLVLTGVRDDAGTGAQALLSNHVHLLLENAFRADEITRLSATIRPRAVALSTVHTVHRIINSTLNLNELVSRLAHLTAQVLRVSRCAIYLMDSLPESGASMSGHARKKSHVYTCKAKVGYPKQQSGMDRIVTGKGVMGRVVKTAQILLRKKMLCAPLIDEDVIGAVVLSGKRDKTAFSHFDLEILTTLAEEAVIAIKNAQLYEEQRRVTLGTIRSLAVILGTQVPTSCLPPEDFLRLTLSVAHDLHLNEESQQALHYATLLKETARVGMPSEILNKPTKLTGEEYDLLREHPIKGAKIVQSFESLKNVAPIILYSREKYDGTGYPEGLKGDRIPMGARILSVVNAFEAIIIGRPYRDQSTLNEALNEITRNSGTQFDPRVVEAFVKTVHQESLHKRLKKRKSGQTVNVLA